MKKFLISVLLLPVLALAQEPVTVEKKLVCNRTDLVINVIIKRFNEIPVWLGEGESNTKYMLFKKENGSWTMIQFTSEIACVVGVGGANADILTGPITQLK